jgi:hypothetical protein
MSEARTPEIAQWCLVLGVSPSASPIVIRAAGKALLVDVHPDRATNETDRVERIRLAKEITEAVAELCDPSNAPLIKIQQTSPGSDAQDRPSTPGPFPFAHRASVTRRPTVADLAQHLKFDLVILLYLANRKHNNSAITALTELTPSLEKEITLSVSQWKTINRNTPNFSPVDGIFR